MLLLPGSAPEFRELYRRLGFKTEHTFHRKPDWSLMAKRPSRNSGDCSTEYSATAQRVLRANVDVAPKVFSYGEDGGVYTDHNLLFRASAIILPPS